MTAKREQNSDRHSRSCHFKDGDEGRNPFHPPFPLETLKRRPDFLKAARAMRWVTPGFIVQAVKREDDNPLIRVGYTASKKVGNAIARNRAKRRLREVAKSVIPNMCQAGHDIVLIARARDEEIAFADLLRDLKWAIKRLGLKYESVKQEDKNGS